MDSQTTFHVDDSGIRNFNDVPILFRDSGIRQPSHTGQPGQTGQSGPSQQPGQQGFLGHTGSFLGQETIFLIYFHVVTL